MSDGKEWAAINSAPVNFVIVIPALDPTEKLVQLAEEIVAVFSPLTVAIVVINDGSDERCADIFKALESIGCDVLAHPCVLGKGAALKAGIAYALSAYPDSCGIVTADADGQHAPRDVFRIAGLLAEGADGIMLGVRDIGSSHVPFRSRWGNRITSLVFWHKTNIRLRDTQTGLRAMPMRHARAVLEARGSRFEYEMNMLLHASKMGIPLATMPIDTIYSDNNSASHFRPVWDSARIYLEILKFGGSSVICAAVDFGLFVLFSSLAFGQDYLGVAISAALARAVSGACNYLANRHVVFRGKGLHSPAKYFILFLTQMALSALFTSLLARGPIAAPAAKLIVDLLLFAMSFAIQRKYVFKSEGDGYAKAN